MTLPVPLVSELHKPVTLPGYLFQLDLPSGTLRYTTRGPFSYDGHQWVPGGWEFRGSAMVLPGGNPAIARLMTSGDIYNARAQVWIFYGEVPTPDTVLKMFDGFIDGISDLVSNITVQLWQSSAAKIYAPRTVINVENGFSVLPPPGLKFEWGGRTISLEAER
jgi:hypothetical protein